MSAAISSTLSVTDAIMGRRSIRRFRPDPVDEATIRTILEIAARAPSGVNMQPWRVYVTTGAANKRLSAAARQSVDAGTAIPEYAYLPETMPEPYLSRRRKVGYDLYQCYGIARDDYPARMQAMLRNFDFFSAPVGVFLTIDRIMSQGAWLDCGMFLQNLMLAARSFGLESCPQQAWCDVGDVVHRELGIPHERILLTGMAIGYADPTAPENELVTERAGVDEFTTWLR